MYRDADSNVDRFFCLFVLYVYQEKGIFFDWFFLIICCYISGILGDSLSFKFVRRNPAFVICDASDGGYSRAFLERANSWGT